MQVKTTVRAGFSRLFALALLCCASLAWTPLAMAQHTSALCPVQTGNVANGGSVVIEITDCIDLFGPTVGPVQGPPTHGTAVLSDLFTPPDIYQAFVTYTHMGNSATSPPWRSVRPITAPRGEPPPARTVLYAFDQ